MEWKGERDGAHVQTLVKKIGVGSALARMTCINDRHYIQNSTNTVALLLKATSLKFLPTRT